jgi:hypothetical protein
VRHRCDTAPVHGVVRCDALKRKRASSAVSAADEAQVRGAIRNIRYSGYEAGRIAKFETQEIGLVVSDLVGAALPICKWSRPFPPGEKKRDHSGVP